MYTAMLKIMFNVKLFYLNCKQIITNIFFRTSIQTEWELDR